MGKKTTGKPRALSLLENHATDKPKAHPLVDSLNLKATLTWETRYYYPLFPTIPQVRTPPNQSTAPESFPIKP
jgi:hypothetical protein